MGYYRIMVETFRILGKDLGLTQPGVWSNHSTRMMSCLDDMGGVFKTLKMTRH